MSYKLRSSSHPKSEQVDVIEPGLVVLRQFVSADECHRIASMTKVMGSCDDREDGFYTTCPESGKRLFNTGERGRGRIYDEARRFSPLRILRHSTAAVTAACEHDATMPNMECTHVLLNMYTTSDGLVWHRDIYENDGTSDHPVVNLSIGASCVFGFKHDDSDEERTVVLRSGDILLFGGRCRLIKHAVLSIDLQDSPEWMKDDPCRFSFTFRDSPEVIGREEEFKHFRVKEHLVGQEQFAGATDPKTCFRHPSLPTQKNYTVEELAATMEKKNIIHSAKISTGISSFNKFLPLRCA